MATASASKKTTSTTRTKKTVPKKTTSKTSASAPKKTAPQTSTHSASNWQGITALVCMIVGFFLIFIPGLNFFLGLAALIFGILGLKTNQKVISIISIVGSAIVLLVSIIMILVVMAGVAIFKNIDQADINNFVQELETEIKDDQEYWELDHHDRQRIDLMLEDLENIELPSVATN